MDIRNVISISGMPGLYKVIAQTTSGGVIVESLIDKKRFPAFASSPISKLEDISIYTTSEELPLKDVYQRIFEKENGGKTIDPKTNDEKAMRGYIETIVPDYDKERVHVSDLRKMFNWYNLLHESGLLTAEESPEEGDDKSVPDQDKQKNIPGVKKDHSQKQNVKSNAPKVKPQGVRKTGTA
jgi:hypothetical protein